jgi:hypothetical protein
MSPEVHRRSRQVFAAPWETCDIETTATVTLGAHSHVAGTSLFRTPAQLVAFDGEASLYSERATDFGQLWQSRASHIDLPPEYRGNVAVWDEAGQRLAIATEWTGSFPLYYTHRRGEGFLFSNRMKVVAGGAALPREIDPLGLLEFLREGAFLSDRCLWNDIKRLQPGQSLVYEAATDCVTLTEHSRLWNLREGVGVNHDELIEAIWGRLRASVDGGATIMTSGGWDSRTLLAAAAQVSPRGNIRAYSHGDPASRELRLAQQLARDIGIGFHQEPIDRRCYELDALRAGFDREEHVVFPHWHRAGTIIAGLGSGVTTAGVYGEVLGGHYGRAMLLQGSAKMLEVFRGLLGRVADTPRASAAQLEALRLFLHLTQLPRPWSVRQDWWEAAHIDANGVNADIDRDLDRLNNRGVCTIDQFIEAYVSEHRGSQYINAQIRSCRAHTDVTLPFTDRRLLEWTTAVPLGVKIHNRINRELLQRYAPSLLRYPMAATLAAGGRPLLVQEASRLARKALELGQWRVHSATGGRVAAPHLSWVNFEFLRSGAELSSIIEDLRAPLWDKPAMFRQVQALARNAAVPTHPMSDQMMKIYTIDLALRSA